MQRGTSLFLSLLAGVAGVACPAAAQMPTDLGTFVPRVVSADGRVFGGNYSFSTLPWRWTVGAGAEALPVLPNYTYGDHWGASADGSVLVGRSGPNQFDTRATRWSPGGVEDLGAIPGTTYSFAYATTEDGTTVVGGSFNIGAPHKPFVWTTVGGMQPLPMLPGWTAAKAQVVTPDGSIIAGIAASAPTVLLVQWTQNGAEQLESLPGANFSTSAVSGISSGGEIMSGYANGRVFRRTPGAGVIDLGQHQELASYATAMSGDGSIIVGYRQPQNPSVPSHSGAFVWTEATGIIGLSEFLVAQGVGGPLMSLTHAYDITPDGLTIVGGTITAPGTQTPNRGWYVTIPDECYPNCDRSTTAPVLNVADFACFLQRFAEGNGWANCDKSTEPPTLNVADFVCYLQRFGAGCP